MAERRATLVNYNNDLQTKKENFQSKADRIPFIGGLSRFSDGMITNNYSKAYLGIGMVVFDAAGGELVGRAGKVVQGAGKELLEGVIAKEEILPST